MGHHHDHDDDEDAQFEEEHEHSGGFLTGVLLGGLLGVGAVPRSITLCSSWMHPFRPSP
jgi:hypothetical protein